MKFKHYDYFTCNYFSSRSSFFSERGRKAWSHTSPSLFKIIAIVPSIAEEKLMNVGRERSWRTGNSILMNLRSTSTQNTQKVGNDIREKLSHDTQWKFLQQSVVITLSKAWHKVPLLSWVSITYIWAAIKLKHKTSSRAFAFGFMAVIIIKSENSHGDYRSADNLIVIKSKSGRWVGIKIMFFTITTELLSSSWLNFFT